MKKYAIITAALLLGAACQTRQHETSSTMEPSHSSSYGTPGAGVQSGSSSAGQSSSPSSVFDSTANHRDALQDNSSALKERSAQPPPDTEINPDVGTPGLLDERGAATERSYQSDKVPQSDTERLDSKDNSALDQPKQDDADTQSLIDSNRQAPIHQEDADATLRPVEPVRPVEPITPD